MKLVTFKLKDHEPGRVGLWVGDRVCDLPAAAIRCRADRCSHRLPPLPSLASMAELLEGGQERLDEAAAVSACAGKRDADFHPVSRIQLLAPVPQPRKVFCLAGNYTEHIKESVKAGKMAGERPQTPRIFMKPSSNTVVGPGAPIPISRMAQWIDWEAELAVVIGRRGRYIAASEAMAYVAGFTVFNDVSERKLRIRCRAVTEEWDRFFDWLNGKWMDGFAPMGPCLVTRDEVGDPHRLRITLRVNGVLKQDGNTADMIFDVGNIIEYLSSIVTLEPGDVIATGTPAGVGIGKGEKLKPGDQVEVEIEKLGVLRNPVCAES